MSSTTRPRVLIADDHPGIVTAIAGLLARDCEVVGSVADGGALLEAAGRLQPDVIVLDLNMPDVNGLEACRQIVQAIPGMKVIMLTAETDAVIMEQALSVGACAFIVKRTIVADLLPAIKRACAARGR